MVHSMLSYTLFKTDKHIHLQVPVAIELILMSVNFYSQERAEKYQ